VTPNVNVNSSRKSGININTVKLYRSTG
jgi:hypothetical protein